MNDVGVSLDDRGLNYGDGLFETVRVVHGRAPLWPRHRERLQQGAARLGISFDVAALESALSVACADVDSAVIKVLLTRGRGGRGYRIDPQQPATLRLSRHPLRLPSEALYRNGLLLGRCDLTLARQPALAGIKHLNRLEQVLARRQVDAEGWDDGLLCG